MIIHQSDLKMWNRCPLQWKFANIDKEPREQSGSLTFGSVLHVCVDYLETHRDLPAAIALFHHYWDDPTRLDPEYVIKYYVRGTNWKKYHEQGPQILADWWSVLQWESDVVLAREFPFSVPIGDGHTLEGTADKVSVRFLPKIGSYVLLITDLKTNKKVPTYEYLEEDLQFSAYCYASTRPEFWSRMPNGEVLQSQLVGAPRWGEWIQLAGIKRMDAGQRTERHYGRLAMACNALARSIEAGIFVPTISGEACRYCDFRKKCGLPELEIA